MSERLVENFTRMVSIDSPTGQERLMADFLEQYFCQRFLTTRDRVNNVLVKIPGAGEPFFFAAHMDTVNPGRGVKPQIRDGRIFSDGNSILGADNKATVAAILETVARLSETDEPHHPLEILFTVDEESGNTGAKGFDYSQLTAKRGLIADIAEPIGTVVLASPAYARFDIQLTGKAAHAAYPENAASVIPALAHLLSQVRTGRIDQDTILNIGTFTGGYSRNTVPGQVELGGEIRSFKVSSLNLALDKLQSLIETDRLNVTAIIRSEIDNPAYSFTQEDPWVQEVSNILRSLNIAPSLVKRWSCSDANIFNSKGLQVVNIGDGTRNTHSTEESVAIADMEKLTQVFMRLATTH